MFLMRRYVHDRGGAAAVEFALVAILMILSVLLIMTVAMILFINQAVDYATTRAARQILTGAAQAGSLTQAAFKSSLCGYLPAALKCSNMVVNLYVVTPGTSPGGYHAYVKPDLSGLAIPALTPGSGQYSLGTRGQYQFLLVMYPITFMPSAFAAILGGGATYNGAPAYLTISTAAFRNELF